MIMYRVWYQTTITSFYYSFLHTRIHTHFCKHKNAVLERLFLTMLSSNILHQGIWDSFFIFYFLIFSFFDNIQKKKQKTKAKTGRSTSSHTKRPWWFVVMACHTLFSPLVLTLVLSLSRSCHLFSPHVSLLSDSTIWLLRYLFLDIMSAL